MREEVHRPYLDRRERRERRLVALRADTLPRLLEEGRWLTVEQTSLVLMAYNTA